MYNNGKLVQMLLQYGADAKIRCDEKEMTLLHIAVTSRAIHAAQALLEHGVDLEVKNTLGRTPLAEAVASGVLPMVQLLLKQRSSVHTRDNLGKTLLMLALEHGRYGDPETAEITLIETLLDHGSMVNVTDEYGRSPLHYLMIHPATRERECFELLVRYGADVNLPDVNKETCLHFAATGDNTAWLLQEGANVGTLDRENRTPLHAAAYEGNTSSLEVLIQHGADVYLSDKMGWLPLHFAAAEVLLQNESDLGAVDNKGRTALYLAVRSGCREVIAFLVHHGSDVNAKDFSGRTILGAIYECTNYFSSWDPQWNIAHVYLENGGDMHAVDAVSGRTALHLAAVSRGITALDNLLDHGLDLEARDKNGETSLHRAAARGSSKISKSKLFRPQSY